MVKPKCEEHKVAKGEYFGVCELCGENVISAKSIFGRYYYDKRNNAWSSEWSSEVYDNKWIQEKEKQI